jgi:hypothetical protein
MGILGKVFKKGTDVFNSKGVEAAADGVKRNVKDFANSGIKSTPAIGSQGATRMTVGGFKASSVSAASNAAKGLGSTAKIGGKVLGYTAIAAVPVGIATKAYSSVKTEQALTDADRRFKFILDNAPDQAPEKFGTDNPLVNRDPYNMGNTGVSPLGLSPAYNLAYGQEGSKESQDVGGSGLGIGVVGIAAVLGGAFYFINKKKAK